MKKLLDIQYYNSAIVGTVLGATAAYFMSQNKSTWMRVGFVLVGGVAGALLEHTMMDKSGKGSAAIKVNGKPVQPNK